MIYIIPWSAQVYELVPSGANVYSVMMHDGYVENMTEPIGWCVHVLPLEAAKQFVSGPDDGYWLKE